MGEWLWLIGQGLGAAAVCFVVWSADRMHQMHMALHREHMEMMEKHLRLLREIAAAEMQEAARDG